MNLERQGYRVVTVSDPNRLLSPESDGSPDLVILGLPRKNWDGPPDLSPALEAFRGFRRNQDNARIPVILLPSSRKQVARLREITSSDDCYLTKPFNPMELIAFVKRIFHSVENEPPPGEWHEQFQVEQKANLRRFCGD